MIRTRSQLAVLERCLGVEIRPYHVSEHEHPPDQNVTYAYADPGEDAIELSWLYIRRLIAMRRRARFHIPINRNQALAAWAVGHELGHLNSRSHYSEYAANRWDNFHLRYVLVRLGLNERQRDRVVWLCQKQNLPVDMRRY